MAEFDYSLDLILKDDEWCRTSTGKEFIFPSNIILLDFMRAHYPMRSFRPTKQFINGRWYAGFKHNSSRECFLVSVEEEEAIESDDSLILAMRDFLFLNIVCTHIYDPLHVTRKGLETSALAWIKYR